MASYEPDDEDEEEDDLEVDEGRFRRTPYRPRWDDGIRARLGPIMAFGGLPLFFWWNIHFDQFGKDFDFQGHPWLSLSFPLGIFVSVFGFGYWLGGFRVGCMLAGGLAALMGSALLIGIALGNYG